MSSNLEDIVPGQVVFVDANIFLYHFTGQSLACRTFLERCEAQEVLGITGAHVVLEVLHRLMMLEAVHKGLISPGNVVRRLKERPDVVKDLDEYARHAGRIEDMGVRILPVDGNVARASHEVRRRAGILINDSVSVAMMRQDGIPAIATQDRDFNQVTGIQIYSAYDI